MKKLTSRGRVKLLVGETEEKEDRVRLRFTVSDTGPGIGQEGQKRIFRAFEQENAGISASFGGTGLGLAISSRLEGQGEKPIDMDILRSALDKAFGPEKWRD